MRSNQKSRNIMTSQGFSLIELMVVLVVLGIVAAIVIPLTADASDEAKEAVFVEDLRQFVQAWQLYYLDTGEFVADGNTGTAPSDWAPYVSVNKWEGGTPIGGQWDIERSYGGSSGIGAGVGVVFGNSSYGFYPGDDVMQRIDAILDDGDISTGGFRQFGTRFYFELMPAN